MRNDFRRAARETAGREFRFWGVAAAVAGLWLILVAVF